MSVLTFNPQQTQEPKYPFVHPPQLRSSWLIPVHQLHVDSTFRTLNQTRKTELAWSRSLKWFKVKLKFPVLKEITDAIFFFFLNQCLYLKNQKSVTVCFPVYRVRSWSKGSAHLKKCKPSLDVADLPFRVVVLCTSGLHSVLPSCCVLCILDPKHLCQTYKFRLRR